MRELLVEQACRFLRHEGVRGALWSEQRAFLEAKGLSEEEVAVAHATVNSTPMDCSRSPGAASCSSSEAESSSAGQVKATARQKLSYLF
mmetsp:Transcript_103188/g.321590  ORF Transcript_103188/g.321590 Transcript_103188/m.321590 type:complete len:89 (-) Transcript_103188:107-373(-)|eukprot:CAMPEP_0204602738 /NCGR_PEP_ID=MMETSP0661-20131031/56842_1 /ASSEMBLY_ACC=CAM_ASM_000606 /TAXON_ID=109239 /ORGANISM="Alexandrium margalefi, Strain AMGDE01CS-322" /LENGTH=88 /DNA_ID=CAMNT_0051613737 /DNA_START=61 /DNA_END=327 /DNA_ORIENTATION=-